MKRFLMAVVMVGVMVVVLTSVAHSRDAQQGKRFIGIWQVVSDAGNLTTFDISDTDEDGQFRYRVNLDFTAICNEEGELGRLLVTPLAPATINADGDLVVTNMLTCLLTDRVIEDSTEVTWRLLDENTLLNVTRGFPAQRISAPPKDDDDD